MKLVRHFSVLAAGALALGLFAIEPVQAQSSDDLVKSLQKKPLTRALNPGAAQQQAKTRSLIEGLKTKQTRAITVEERTDLAKVVKESNLPAIDLEIFFDFNSAAIAQAALPKLVVLGDALSNPKLKGQTFLIAGHTDAVGGNAYNQQLSEARALSVKQYLIETYKLTPGTLLVVGYGEEQLKIPQAPDAAENRRVQIVNLQVD